MDNTEITEQVRIASGDLRARADEARRVAAALFDDDQVLVALPRDLALDLARRLLQAVSPAPSDWRTVEGFRLEDVGSIATGDGEGDKR